MNVPDDGSVPVDSGAMRDILPHRLANLEDDVAAIRRGRSGAA